MDLVHGDLLPHAAITATEVRIAGVECGTPQARPEASLGSHDGAYAVPAHPAGVRKRYCELGGNVRREDQESVAGRAFPASYELLTAFAHGTTGARVVDTGLQGAT